MNRNALVAVVLSVACTACVKEIDTPVQETLVSHEYKISIDNPTKTTADAAGKLSWAAGDVIRYYSTSNGAVSSATVTESGPSTSLTMNVAAGARFLVAAYGGTGISQNTSGNSFVLNGVLGTEQSGKFEDAHIAVVKTYDVNDASLHFVNVTSLVKFTLERDDVAYVVFKSNDDTDLHGDGTLHFSFSDVEHSASFDGTTANNVKVNVGDAGTYYISTLPCTLPAGFTMSFYKSDDSYIGRVTTDKNVSLSKNKILNLGTLDSRIDTTPVGPIVKYEPNLSLNGTANCYIIPVAGEYYFDATVKGSSSEPIGGNDDYASVLWESFGTDVTPKIGDLVRNCRYENGKIYFTATGENGNAVIALANRDEEIIWSWHIWCCMGYDADFYAQEYYNNAGTMMDRNLGATSATPGDVKALGLLYQWGRKDPFLSGGSISSNTKAKSTITWPSTVSSTSSNGTIAYAIAHPTTFITYNSSNYDWYYTGSSSTDNTRWQTSDKTKGLYDPCPAGYRVPDGGSNGVWAKAFGTSSYWETSSNWDAINRGMDFGKTDKKLGSASTIWYPAAGYLNYTGGSLCNVGSYGHYWSCTPNSYYAYYLDFYNVSYVSPTRGDSRAYGLSVRCVKED